MSNFNPNQISNMSMADINAVLESGIFLAKSVKTQLEQRLDYIHTQTRGRHTRNQIPEKKPDKVDQDKYSSNYSLADCISVKTHSAKNKNKNKNKLGKVSPLTHPKLTTCLDLPLENLEQPMKKVLNFKKIIDNTIIDDADLDSNPLFVNNDLVIDYQEIETIYTSYGIDRIHIHYLNLSRKINILDRTDPDIKNLFEYDGLCAQREIMKYCSYIYIQIHNMINILESCVLLQNTYGFDESELIYMNKISEVMKIVNEIRYHLNPIFNSSILKFNSIKKSFIAFVSEGTNVSNKSDRLQNLIRDLSQLETDLIAEFDPKIDCDYYVEFKRQSPKANITAKGISFYAYHLVKNITMKPYDEIKSEYLTVDQVTRLFNQRYKSDSSNIIYLYPPVDSIMKPSFIFFTIGDDIPFAKGGVSIYNLPEGTKSLTSTIVNHKLESDFKDNFPSLVSPHINKWFKMRTPHEVFVPDKSEYTKLSDNIKSIYSLADADQNIFFVDVVFDQLLEFDSDNTIIKPDMIDSFRKLAYDSS